MIFFYVKYKYMLYIYTVLISNIRMTNRTINQETSASANALYFDYTFLGQGQGGRSRSSIQVKGIGQGILQSRMLNICHKETVNNMNVKMNGSNELYKENGFEGKLLRNFKDFEVVTSLTISKEVFKVIGRVVTEKSIMVQLENSSKEQFSATVQAYKLGQDDLVLKFGNRVSINLDFYEMVITRNGKYLSDKSKDRIMAGFDVPMTLEEIEERRVKGLYKDFVDTEINDRFIHPDNVQSFELWLSYTYPRQLARQKAMAEIEVVEIKPVTKPVKETVKA